MNIRRIYCTLWSQPEGDGVKKSCSINECRMFPHTEKNVIFKFPANVHLILSKLEHVLNVLLLYFPSVHYYDKVENKICVIRSSPLSD